MIRLLFLAGVAVAAISVYENSVSANETANSTLQQLEKLNPHIRDGGISTIFSDKSSPVEKAFSSIKSIQMELESSISTIGESIKLLEDLTSADMSKAREMARATTEKVETLLEKVRDGGAVVQIITTAKSWMSENARLAASDSTLSEYHKRTIAEGWRKRQRRLNQGASQIDGIRGTLKIELKRLTTSRNFLEHMAALKLADAMNKAIEDLVRSMNATLGAIQKLGFREEIPTS